ncbi:hypothetical protein HZI56_07300 [Lactobacillus salivarius]|uniref:Uncharacterized protein n=1 Tax=Ligilactobacillus salivarius TaxID=1624 RepID=A0A7X2ME91_9LACO|nr:hypothetical protein [Ligilactobacillus salivarius]MSE07905.1 hypothetical protein [Ligilactobacillus salivarius]NXZ96867.1 hypothetical protein [Ligilactobacillus salivarius]NYA60106.1 hypothetical protein [Ligilactobacillus salivarius]NYA61786.1 hypothetical protein [Ligilactobacillus salivarius]NYA63694.1 hypothetical protein [Ligilactobacillus salivarius]
MLKYEVITDNVDDFGENEKEYFTDVKKLINYVHEVADGHGYDKYEREDYIGYDLQNAIDFLQGFIGYTVKKREDKVLSITGNNEAGVNIEGIVDGKLFGQWYEDLEDFNNYFDTHLNLNNWAKSVVEAKQIIEEDMQYTDCEDYIYND